MISNILLILSLSSLFVLLLYSFLFYRFNSYKPADNNFKEPISIIICARNEEENLRDNLPLILSQSLPVFEVIVVNDQSEDNTENVLKKFEEKHNNLVVVTINHLIKHRPGKKFALTLGIKTAKYEYVLLTDADCVPNSSDWAKRMSANFCSSDIVLGFGAYEKKTSFLNKIIRFDTFNIAQQYFSYALSGMTYMGVGRNMGYKKSLFFENKGFAKHIHIASGDDDLFVQEVSAKDNVSIQSSIDSHTVSEVMNGWKEWVYQKRRHTTTASLYKTKFKILLGVYPYAQFIFWISLVLLFLLSSGFILPILLLIIKLLVSYIINYQSMKRMDVFDLYWAHPFYEFLYLFLQGFFVLLNFVSKPKEWSK